MTHRSPAAVFLLPVVTLGIYWFVWLAKTRGELNAQGAKIPTTWLYILPIVSYWYLWRLASGAALVSGKSAGGVFALLLLLGNLGGAIVQSGLNNSVQPHHAAPVSALA